MLVVLGEGDDVALGGDFETTAPTHLHIRTLKLANQRAIALEDGHMEAVSVAVADEDVTSVADVNAIGVVGDTFAADAVQEVTLFIEHHHTVALFVRWLEFVWLVGVCGSVVWGLCGGFDGGWWVDKVCMVLISVIESLNIEKNKINVSSIKK